MEALTSVQIELKFTNVGFCGGRKALATRREPTTNSTHMRRLVRESRAYPLRYPCSPNIDHVPGASRHRKAFSIPFDSFSFAHFSLACRCAQAASAKGYTTFGLQFYGECWSGSDSCDQYSRYGDSEYCIGQNYTRCDINDDTECMGQQSTNFVYLLLEGKQFKIEVISYDHNLPRFQLNYKPSWALTHLKMRFLINQKITLRSLKNSMLR